MSGLFSTSTKKEEPVRMPVPDDPASKAAQERERRKVANRGGRASTILTSPESRTSTAGTTSYTNSLLGQAG